MKNRKIFLLVLILLMTMFFTACGSEEPAGPQEPVNPAGPEEPADTDEADDPVEPSDEYIHVSSTQELLAALVPDAKIIIEPGYYNMSEYIEAVWAEEGENWNNAHEYVKMQECYDGTEIVVQNADGIVITGGGKAYSDTELVVDPRYAAILTFDNCNDLKISNMTMGHTMFSNCEGNVINFIGCSNVEIDSMDLYGCGVYGIMTRDFCGDILVNNSIIRDCEYGALYIDGGKGKVELRGCNLTGSYGGGGYLPSETSELHFYGCTFGTYETQTWYFYENIVAEDCQWSEIESYPEYS